MRHGEFTHDGIKYRVDFISADGVTADYRLTPRGIHMHNAPVNANAAMRAYNRRFSDKEARQSPKGCILRRAYAAYKRAMNNDFRQWAKRNGYNIGDAWRMAHGKSFRA